MPLESTLIGRDQVVEDPAVELLHSMVPRVERQLRIEHSTLDAELLEEQLNAVPAVRIVDKDQALPLDQPQLKEDVEEEELVLLVRPDVVLAEISELILIVLELEHDRVTQQDPLELLDLARHRRTHQEALVHLGQAPRPAQDRPDVLG